MNPEWTDPDPDRPIRLLAAVLDDVRAHFPTTGQGKPPAVSLRRIVRVAVTSPGFRLTWNYRLSHSVRGGFGPVGRLLSAALFGWGRRQFGCSIAPTARLHGGLILPHPQGLVIGPGAIVGPRAWIFQNVTVGGAPDRDGLPRVGADARIYAGAVLSGPISVGDEAVIGANAVVSRDLPARSVARPAAIDVAPLPARPPFGNSTR